ncbi:M1 family metallopeptidase [Nocardioides sp. CN2-186]|uniref:M1 family metallopeptidase n=1 Tax=Nocardioides tweenelious TaxID=3156607 RepID=UPI0032B4E44B
MLRQRVLALGLTSLLAVALLGPGQSALGQAHRPHGAAGIGDSYFPLDGNGGIDVLRYDVHDRYDLASGRLSGWTDVRLRGTASLSGFDLDFLLPVSRVTVDGKKASFNQKRYHELSIQHRLDQGETVVVRVKYAGTPGDYRYAGESNWLADQNEVVAMNQPHMAPWWFPANDHPLDKAMVDVHITVPKGLDVISNGVERGRTVHGATATTHWSADEPMVPYLAFFAAGRFKIAKGVDHGRPWLVAVSESKKLNRSAQDTSMRLMKMTPELVDWEESALGLDYPFSVTGGLTTSLNVGFALENQTRPTYPYMGGGEEAVLTVVHELAHQWFGDSVAVHHWKDIWLNEGFATFMENYYTETHDGPSANAELRDYYDRTPAGNDFWKHEVADPCADGVECVNSIFATFVYQRGELALQALRNVVGDAAFFDILRTWATDHAGGNGATEQFEALAEEISGQDLDAFFSAWLHSTAKPADTEANGLGALSPEPN